MSGDRPRSSSAEPGNVPSAEGPGSGTVLGESGTRGRSDHGHSHHPLGLPSGSAQVINALPTLTDPGQWSPARPQVGLADPGMRFAARAIDTLAFVIL